MMNRNQLRSVQHLPRDKFYEVIKNVVAEEVEKEKHYTFYNLGTAMYLALIRRFPEIMTGDMCHSIAVDAVEISNGIEPPQELAEMIKEKTGFDIYMPPSQDDKHTYIPKEQGEGTREKAGSKDTSYDHHETISNS